MYDELAFKNYKGPGYTGTQLYAARQVMAHFIDALAGGYADLILPSPGYLRSDIDDVIHTIDEEWEVEHGRDRRYRNHTEFSTRLTPLARAALVEAIEKALGASC